MSCERQIQRRMRSVIGKVVTVVSKSSLEIYYV